MAFYVGVFFLTYFVFNAMGAQSYKRFQAKIDDRDAFVMVKATSLSGNSTTAQRQAVPYIDIETEDGHWMKLFTLGEGAKGSVYKVFPWDLNETLALALKKNLENTCPLSKAYCQLLSDFIKAFDEANWKQDELALKVVADDELKNQVVQKEVDNLRAAYYEGKEYIVWVLPLLYRYKPAHKVCVLLEAMDGDLESQIPGGGLDVAKATNIFGQVVQGVQACHKANVAHLDLKPANVLVKGGGEDITCKLADFDKSELVPGGEVVGCRGSPAFWAPEINAVAPPDINTRNPGTACTSLRFNGFKADIFSLGILLYNLVTGEVPSRGATSGEINSRLTEVRSNLVARGFDFVKLTKMINKLTQLTATERPGIEEVAVAADTFK